MKLKLYLVLFLCLGYANSSSDGFESCSSSLEKSGRNVIAAFNCANNNNNNSELTSNDFFGPSLNFHCGNVNVTKTEVAKITLHINETCGVTEFPVEMFKTFNNLNELIITIPTLDSLDPWNFYDASKLTSFVLHGRNDMELPGSLLAHLAQLKSFHAILTRFQDIHLKSFQQATNLEQLRLTGAELTSLPLDLLRGLTKLRIMDLSSNNFTHVNILDLTYCTSIETLDLQQNQISNIAAYSLEQMTALKHLFLSENEIIEIKPQTFSQMENLTTLTLSHNQLERLAGDMFEGLINLKTLELSHNGIQHIAANTFLGMNNLEKIDLSNNEITQLDERTFGGLYELKYIDLSHNLMTDLPMNVFSELVNLKQLTLTGGKLTTLDFNLFGRLPSLKFLNLANNDIKHLVPFSYNTNFTAIGNSGRFDVNNALIWINSLENYENSLVNLVYKMLFELNLTENHLRVLDLSHNKIEYLDDYIFSHFKNLQMLSLNFNPVTAVNSKAIEGLGKLDELDLPKVN